MSLPGPSRAEILETLEAQRERGWLELVQRHGRTFGFQGLVATCEPAVVDALLHERAHTDLRSRLYEAVGQLMPGMRGLLFLGGEPWVKRARALLKQLTRAHVDTVARRLHQAASAQLAGWPAGPQGDLAEALSGLGLAVFVELALGLPAQSALAREVSQALVAWRRATEDPRWRMDGPTGPLQRLAYLPLMRRALGQGLARVRPLLAQATAEGESWRQHLARGGLSPGELAEEVTSLYWAYDAVVYQLTCLVARLSLHPAWAAQLRAELQGALGPEAHPTRADFERLPRTQAFIQEVLRMHPATMGVTRRTGAALAAGGVSLPRGTEVVILLYPLHHDPAHWDRPLEFDPGRWLGTWRPAPNTYLPFLEGPRRCVGRHLAELLMVTTLNALLRRFEVELPAPLPRITTNTIPRFEQPIPFVLRPAPLPA